jgi:hypothetical protein
VGSKRLEELVIVFWGQQGVQFTERAFVTAPDDLGYVTALEAEAKNEGLRPVEGQVLIVFGRLLLFNREGDCLVANPAERDRRCYCVELNYFFPSTRFFGCRPVRARTCATSALACSVTNLSSSILTTSSPWSSVKYTRWAV